MPRVTNLIRLLNSSTQPVYALGHDRRIVFVNAACAQWLAVEAAELLGQQCNYHAGDVPQGPAAVATLLCPSPEALDGDVHTGVIARRAATFLVLRGEDEEAAGLLVIVGDETQTVAEDSAESAAELHLQIQRTRAELAARYTIDALLGDTPAIRRARAQAALAAESHAAVLIFGPRGSPREELAKAIHNRASSGGRLIPLSCAVLGAGLLASTVQAAVASEFGGAESRSTLLLLDVDQLPFEAQVELEHAIAGAPLRLLATAERSIVELAAQDKFRAELACMLATIVIELPALSSRRADLPIVAQALVEAENARGGKQIAGFTPEALDELAAYDWPGDLEELTAMVRESHAGAQGRLVTAAELPRRISLAREAAAHPQRALAPIDLEQTLARIETTLIERALAHGNGNKSRAAEVLGISRHRLLRRLAQLGMAGESPPPVEGIAWQEADEEAE